MKNISWFFIFILAVALIIIGFSMNQKKNTTATVTINGHIFKVELAQTEAQRQQGLMNRTHLAADAGMLFIFPQADIYPFWMKKTKIPLDIIYIDNNRIVEMTTLQEQSDNNIPQYTPKNKADRVLEINAGLAQKYGFQLSDSVEIKN